MATPKQQIKPFESKMGGREAWGKRVRDRIDSSLHINTLERIASGEEEGTQVQLNAIRMLLDRTVPTIKPIEVKQGGDQNAKSITNSRLLDVIEGAAVRVENK